MNLLQQLTKKHLLSKEKSVELEKTAKNTTKTVEEIILEKKLISEKDLFETKSQVLNVPLQAEFLEEINSDALSIIPKESADFYKTVPLKMRKMGDTLDVGMVYPENIQAKEALKFLARQHRLQIKVYLITISDFKKYFLKYQAVEQEVERALESLEEEVEIGSSLQETRFEKSQYGRMMEEAPIIKMVAVIMRQAVEGKASDIHIEPTYNDTRVRYRLDGVLYSSLILPKKVHTAIIARIKILSRLKIDENRLPQGGRFSATIANRRIDFRVAIMPTTLGEKVSLRVLDPTTGVETLKELGLTDRNLEVVERVIKEPYGMVLVTGPTGSGKTTTLYTALRLLNKEEVNVVTLEDPVEYSISGVNQSQVNPDINFQFSTGLRQILRQDPDIIMVGEVRDEETAALSIHAALTGHLVLSTMHTTSAVGVIPRLIDMGVKPFLVSPTFTLSISQRLARVLCPHCKKKVELTGSLRKYVLDKIKNMPSSVEKTIKSLGPLDKLSVYQPGSCKKCNSRGFIGRIGIFEVLEMSEKIARIILEDVNDKDIFHEARAHGMTTMEEDGIIKALKGMTSLEEIMRITHD